MLGKIIIIGMFTLGIFFEFPFFHDTTVGHRIVRHWSIIEPLTSAISPSSSVISTNNNNNNNLHAEEIAQQHSQLRAQSPSRVDGRKHSGKGQKVSNWLSRKLSKLPKLPWFRQRLSSVLCPEARKKQTLMESGGQTPVVPQSVQMSRALEDGLAEIKCRQAACNPPKVDDVTPLFVIKWIDYSNKYGLGFQLSDKSVGVLFNDSTKMSYTPDRR